MAQIITVPNPLVEEKKKKHVKVERGN